MNTNEHSDQFRKIFNHPDKSEIITRLVSGESVRQVEAWLRIKYPGSRKNQVSFVTLQNFRKQHLNIEADVLKDLQKERNALRLQKRHDDRVQEIKESDTYRASLASYVQESLIDYNSTLLMLRDKCMAGIERLEDLDDEKGSHLNHTAITTYLKQIQDLMELHYKILKEQEKRSSDQVELDYETLNKQVGILMEVIKEIFQEMAPELQPIFISRVRDRMKQEGLYD